MSAPMSPLRYRTRNKTRLTFLWCAALMLPIMSLPVKADSIPEVQRLLKQGQSTQALEKADVYVGKNPKDPQGRFLKGIALTELNRIPEALAIFSKLTEDFPELPEPYNNLAVLYAQQKQYDKARTALEMAIRTHPSYTIAHENLGDIYAKLASQAYDKALQLDNSNATAQSKMALIRDLISLSGKTGASKPTTSASSATANNKAPEPVKLAEKSTPAPNSNPPAAAAPALNKAGGIPVVQPNPVPVTQSASNSATPTTSSVPPVRASDKPQDKAQEKPPEKPADKAPPAKKPEEADVEKSLRAWADAWSRKDVKSYLASYGPDFDPPGGQKRKAWEEERRVRIDKPGKIDVDVENVRIDIDGDKATVRFRQHYQSANLKTSASKTLVMRKTKGRWQILQERVN